MKATPSPTAPEADAGLEAILSEHGQRSRWRRWRIWLAAGLVLILAAGYALLTGSRDSEAPKYLTEAAKRGDLMVKVTATGNLEPTNQVDVGSELSGTIVRVLVDDDDRVTKGQVLAELEASAFEDSVAQSRAAVEAAEAGLKQAEATVAEAHARLERYREVARLSGGKVPSKTEMETAEAELARAEADAASAEASIAQSRAGLRANETNLAKTRIVSPIDGVVLERSVDPGQAVAASLQAVTLFKLAEDLSKMELKVDVDEADVALVKPGLKTTFTVDAWPDRRFEAVITRVGFNATDDEGVISYPAVLEVQNDDLSLRPGMTGTAEITTLTLKGALLAPNAALRFTPPEAIADQAAPRRSFVSSLIPRPPSRTRRVLQPVVAEDGTQRVWVLRENEAVPLSVRCGATDGRYTEILGGELEEGMEVIVESLGSSS